MYRIIVDVRNPVEHVGTVTYREVRGGGVDEGGGRGHVMMGDQWPGVGVHTDSQFVCFARSMFRCMWTC